MEKKILICIGRQYGSGGRHIARKLGEKLGIDVYDNELISKAAEESGFSRNLFAENDEKKSIFSFSSFFPTQRTMMSAGYMNENELFSLQSDVIRNIAEKGSAIFVGRCANYILRDDDILSIFVTAPMANRIERVCSRDGVKPEEAENYIRRKEKGRATYYNFFTNGNWGDAAGYDVCIDTSLLDLDGTVDILLEIINKKYCR